MVTIKLLDEFERNFKRLSKKYRSMGEDFKTFKQSLEDNHISDGWSNK